MKKEKINIFTQKNGFPLRSHSYVLFVENFLQFFKIYKRVDIWSKEMHMSIKCKENVEYQVLDFFFKF